MKEPLSIAARRGRGSVQRAVDARRPSSRISIATRAVNVSTGVDVDRDRREGRRNARAGGIIRINHNSQDLD